MSEKHAASEAKTVLHIFQTSISFSIPARLTDCVASHSSNERQRSELTLRSSVKVLGMVPFSLIMNLSKCKQTFMTK